jgi:hypothetical protein
MQIAPPFNNHIDSSTHTFNNTFITNNMDFCTLGMFIIGKVALTMGSTHFESLWTHVDSIHHRLVGIELEGAQHHHID